MRFAFFEKLGFPGAGPEFLGGALGPRGGQGPILSKGRNRQFKVQKSDTNRPRAAPGSLCSAPLRPPSFQWGAQVEGFPRGVWDPWGGRSFGFP